MTVQSLNKETMPLPRQTEAATNLLNNWTLTINESMVRSALVEGKDIIVENFYYPNPAILYLETNKKRIQNFTSWGVLDFGQVTEKFKQVTNSVLQGRDIKEITKEDMTFIVKRYYEWGIRSLPGYSFNELCEYRSLPPHLTSVSDNEVFKVAPSV